MSDFSETFIEERIEAYEAPIREFKDHWTREKERYMPVLRKLAHLGAEFYAGDRTYLQVNLMGDGHVLAEAMRALRAHGFNTYNSKPAKNDPTWSSFWTVEGAGDWHIRIYLNFTSSVCRRVKTGTKTVVQDVFEIVCGEHGAAGESLQTPAVDDSLPF